MRFRGTVAAIACLGSLVSGVASPGGLAFDRSGKVLMGYENSILGGTTGTRDPQAGLLRIDPKTGDSHVYVDGRVIELPGALRTRP